MASEQQNSRDHSAQRTIRLVRPSVVVLCGPAACGKSTFALRHFRPTQVISSDQARALVSDDERDQRFQMQAFALLHFLIEQRLSINRLCVVDSTALTLGARKSLLELARKYRVRCLVLLFDVPLMTCIQRDQARERSVGRQTIERQYQLFEHTKSDIRQEGFDQVLEIREEDLEKARIEIVFRPPARLPGWEAPHERRRFVPRYGQGQAGRLQPPSGVTSPSQPSNPPPEARAGPSETSPPASDSAPPAAAPNPSQAQAETQGKS